MGITRETITTATATIREVTRHRDLRIPTRRRVPLTRVTRARRAGGTRVHIMVIEVMDITGLMDANQVTLRC